MTPSQQTASFLATLIECGADEASIKQRTMELVNTLGGIANIQEMTTGAAAIYLIALIARLE